MKRIGLTLMAILLVAPNGFSQIINVPADQPTIQEGINVATDGDTVLVADSTYYENINFNGKAITVASHFLVDGDTSHITNTIIDGNQAVIPEYISLVTMNSGEDTTSVLCGFTVTRGSLFAIRIFESGGLICNNRIIYNKKGGIWADVSNGHTATIRGNRILRNGQPGGKGAGVRLKGGRIILERNTISYNVNEAKIFVEGCGVIYYGSDQPGVIPEVIIRNNEISKNLPYGDLGGAIGSGLLLSGTGQDIDFKVYNNLIFGHYEVDRGCIYMSGIEAKFVNNTVANNYGIGGVQIYLNENAHAILLNNIFCDNGDGNTAVHLELGKGNTLIAKYNLIKGSWEGEGNIDADPHFYPGSYNLIQDSPCIGSAADSILVGNKWYYAPATDITGQNRYDISPDSRIDMGAIESPYVGYVYIPDTAFLYALIDEGVDTNGDSLISFEEAEAITSLDLGGGHWSSRNISDMTGIEAFISLDTLICYNNKLTSLDVSNNTALTYLDCTTNQLTSLDVSNNTALTYLECNGNRLTSLDVSKNSNLTLLDCSNNSLTSLDVSNCTALIHLYCYANQIKGLDISNNTELNELNCYGNQLTSLDVTHCSEISELRCHANPLVSLNISNCTALKNLYCELSKLTSLDVSTCTGLSLLKIGYTPSLSELCVWILPFPPAGVNVDTTGSPNVCFETICDGDCSIVGIEEKRLSELSIYPNPTNDIFTIETGNIGQHSINIISPNGQTMYSTMMEGISCQIDFSSFQKGVYIITIRSKDFITTKKIIKY